MVEYKLQILLQFLYNFSSIWWSTSYKSYYNFLQTLGVSFLLGRNILHSSLFFNVVFSYVEKPGFGFINKYLFIYLQFLRIPVFTL